MNLWLTECNGPQVAYFNLFAETTSQTENNLEKSSEQKEGNSDSKQTTKEKQNQRKPKIPKTKKGLGKKMDKKKTKKT